MNDIQKAIAKLSREHKAVFDSIMMRLLARDFLGLDITKLKGHKDVFRVKRGKLRVIFRMSHKELLVLEVGLRSEKTYKNF